MKQRDNKDGKGKGQGQDTTSGLIDAQFTLNQRSTSAAAAAASSSSSASSSAAAVAARASGIALASNQGHQSVTSPSHCFVTKGTIDCSKIVAGVACESDGLVAYCGVLWRIYVKALSCMVTMTDRDMHNAQQTPSTVSAINAARELKAVEGIVDADADGDADGEELDGIGDLRSNAESGMIGRGAMVGQRVAHKGREGNDTGDALAIPVRPRMGSRADKGAPGPLTELPLQSNGSVLVSNMGLRAGRDSKGHGQVHGQVQVQERSKGAVLFASLIAPDKAAGVLTQALRLLYKHPLETVKCLSVLTQAILLDTGWRVRTSPLKVLLRLLTPLLQHAKHKGKGKGREKGKEKKQINASGNENQTVRCTGTAGEKMRAREEEEAEGALEEMEAFIVAADCLRKVVSMTSRHSSQILRLGGPSSSSTSSSSSSTAASASNGVPPPAPVGADHPSAVGGILLYLLQSRPVPTELSAPNCSPALSALRDCMAYERALKGAQCTAALFDGLRDLLSLSSPSPQALKSKSVDAPTPVPGMLSSVIGNSCSTEACRAVAEHGLFAQRAGSPEGNIARTPALEVLQCLSRLPDCFVLLNAADSHSIRRQRAGVNIGDALKCAERGDSDDDGDVQVGWSSLRRGRHEERLHTEVLVTLHALLSAWQLGVNAIGRHFTGMEVTEEGEMGAQALAQQDSQRSSSAFSQSASQRFSAGRSQYGVSQQVRNTQIEVNTLSLSALQPTIYYY
jgi:hypothetical protein